MSLYDRIAARPGGPEALEAARFRREAKVARYAGLTPGEEIQVRRAGDAG